MTRPPDHGTQRRRPPARPATRTRPVARPRPAVAARPRPRPRLRLRVRRTRSDGLGRVARRRIGTIGLALLVAFAALSVRVVQLQALSGSHYEKIALRQRLDKVTLPAERGSIFDRNGRDLALSVQQPTIWANPQVIVDAQYDAQKLAPIVGVSEATLVQRLSDTTHQFVYVARRVTDDVAQRVRALGLPGIAFIDEPSRTYPAGTLAAPVLGTVGGEQTGLSGLESEYDGVLEGHAGYVVAERDVRGREIPRTVRREVPARRGTDLVLTLDEALQYETERSLADEVTASSAQGGWAIVLDTRTGDILSMATVTGATPGHAAQAAGPLASNQPLTYQFEPGSTNKVVTIATAIERGLITPDTRFTVNGQINVAGKIYRDDHQHGPVSWSTTDILRESSNVGTIQIARLLGKFNLNQALHNFGLGTRTTVEFPAQADGSLLSPDQYYGTGLASVPIGYGVAVTAQQMLDVYAALARDGVSVSPRLVSATIDGNGVRHSTRVRAPRRVVSAATSRQMTAMLSQVVANGTGACAAIPGYTVAGKTGTSHKLLPNGRYENKYMASFIGFAPAESPRVAAIVVIDAPSTMYGARAAAPVFAEVGAAALRLLKAPPPDPTTTQFEQAQRAAQAAGEDCTVPHGAALQATVAENQRRAAQAALHARQTGAAGASKPARTKATGTLPAATSPNP